MKFSFSGQTAYSGISNNKISSAYKSLNQLELPADQCSRNLDGIDLNFCITKRGLSICSAFAALQRALALVCLGVGNLRGYNILYLIRKHRSTRTRERQYLKIMFCLAYRQDEVA